HDRIPNFKDAASAAESLLNHEIFRDVRKIKVNPDAPQRYVRERALERDITVYMPTPRLRGGFKKFEPADIPEKNYSDAASLSKGEPFAQEVSLDELPEMDIIVAGSVAVTKTGKRCGKGHGYSDLEYAILRELGHSEVPVMTTVHDIQVVNDFPRDEHDVPLSLIATPTQTIRVENPPPAPQGIHWDILSEKDLNDMPILTELKQQS
ncbi:MAG: 5-formyltetrahydrofolate cyclo-ligase, partial [Candidatus Marinimicrobia bacterium]|nr:5-formyltetrahydrofolate cyclo-ligase [Candidatus Neomarinimicrobiota bacterium]